MKFLSILILGGTGFIGSYQIRYAIARGHRVTVFNRGQQSADLPRSVEQLVGDRNTNDYTALKNRQWDVCIDNPARVPHWVRDAGAALKGSIGHYIFVSTTSVYASDQDVGQDETAPRLTYTHGDPMAIDAATLAKDMSRYGALKACCEDEAHRQFPDITTIIRPGLIVGPGDESDRFTYWPVRIQCGGTVLAPPLQDPVQFIDVRDLAEWMIRLAETRSLGTFNAKGPDMTLTFGTLMNCIRDVTNSDAMFCEATEEFLAAHGVEAWRDLPVWIPATGETAGAHRRSNQRAITAGLTYRLLTITVADTLAWWGSLPLERQANLRWGMSVAREAEVLSVLKKR